jgi:N-acetylmuramoyl-L-alanine amidase
MSKLSKTILLLIIFNFILNGVPVVSAQQTRPGAEDVRTFLEGHPLLVQSDTRVLDVTIQGEALVINLGSSILPDGQYDAEIFYQLEKDLDATLFVNQYFMLTFKVEGLSLEAWGRPLPEFVPVELPDSQRDTLITGPLSGYKIALNPGHGRYWNEVYSEWRWQRVLFYDIREDLVNAEIVRLVALSLINHGATVIDEREMDPVARIGASGLQAWQEAARHYAIYQGLPEAVWNGAIIPWDTNYNDDIRARPYIANYYGADLMISLHNNGYDGTLSGTETYYDTTADYHDPAESYRLANAVHYSIINTIRSKYDSSWVDRKVKASDGNYGEIHYTSMPSILLELAFMDKQFPDNTYLKDKNFRVFVAEAIVDGICSYLGETCGDIPISSTLFAEVPTLAPEASGNMCSSGWFTYTNQRLQTAALTPNLGTLELPTNSATWQSFIPYNGMYHVEAFIPAHAPLEWQCPPLTLSGNTASAHYRITHGYGTSSIWVDQSQASDQWVDLGVYYFRAGEGATIRLDNATGEPASTAAVSFSAIRLNLVGMNKPVFTLYFPLVTN